jgi:exodeoxyribonuclease V beta subunit
LFKEILFESYSSILKASSSFDFAKESKSLEVDPLDIPACAETGDVFHKIFEKIFERGLYLHLQEDAIKSLVHQEITSTVLENFEEKVMERVKATLFAKYNLNGVIFEFSSLDCKKVFCEMEFSLFDQQRYLKGVIDLFFEFEGKYYIIDWKTNYLGAERSSYEQSSLKSAIIEHQYDLQAGIYTKAAKMLLKKKGKENAFGGIFYVFIRGVDRAHIGSGVYSFSQTNQQEIAYGI